MHKMMAGVTILEHELSDLRLLVERQTGVLLDCPNSALGAHVAEYIESRELQSPAELLESLRASDQNPSVLPGFLDGVLNVNTGFFRHPGAMSALANYVVPQLYARKSEDGPCALRIWSAGCSTGEEAYSIAMALCESLPNGTGNAVKEKSGTARGGIQDSSSTLSTREGQPREVQGTKDWSVHIVGTDLLPSAIEVAERGLYPQSALAGLPPASIRAAFSKIASSNIQNGALEGVQAGPASSTPASAHLLVKPRLRSLVTFNTMNLTKPVYIGRFDCIFCMDVLPHLSRVQRIALIERLHLYLEPGGYLFLSQTEKLSAPNLNFRPEVFDGYTVHRKPLAASAAYGR
jgi:chemotaxis methyl-accepting protein methylase